MVWNIWIIFPYIGNVIIPTDELIFFRGVETTNQYFTVPIFTIFFTYLYLFKEKKTISLILKYKKPALAKHGGWRGSNHIYLGPFYDIFLACSILGGWVITLHFQSERLVFIVTNFAHKAEYSQFWSSQICIYMFVIVWSNFLNCQRFFRVWSKTPSESKNEFRLLSRSARLANQNRSPSWAMLCLECGPSVGGGNEPSP